MPGDLVAVASGGPVNLRRSAGYINKPVGDVVAIVGPATIGTVLDGPTTADGLRWWNVRFPQGEGWMADRSGSGKVLLDRSP